METNLSLYKLLLPEKTEPAVLFAAEELDEILGLCNIMPLTRIIEKKSGDKVISLGETSLKQAVGLVANPNSGGGYNIDTEDGDVFIYSRDLSGIINGVYGFCERTVGYRFYAEDEIRVEKRDEYYVKEIHVSEKPDFMGRRLDSFQLYHNLKYSLRLRQNESYMDKDERMGEGTPWAELHDQSLAFQLIPLERYKTEEFIAKGWWSEKGDQLCWTKAFYDVELFELLCENLIKVIKAQPDKKFYMLGQTDNPWYCECDVCKRDYAKYGVSGVFLRLVNKLADRVKEFIDREQGGREHYLCMFAYLQTLDPPVKVENGKIVPLDSSVVARDNVMIRIAPIESGVMYSHLDARINPHSTASFIGWRAVASHFAVWDYGTDFSAYAVPYPDWDVLADNIRFFKDYGAVDLLTQVPAHTAGTEFAAMKLYVRARLMWDVSLDEEKLYDEFINVYYGAAADSIRKYIAILKKHYEKLKREAAYTATIYVPLMQAAYWDYGTIEEIERIFEQAYAAVRSSESGERLKFLKSG